MKRSAVLAVLILYGAMVLATLVSRLTFERLPRLEDEFTYLYQARLFQQGDIYTEPLQPAAAYWQPFVISQDDKRFGKYPPAWPLLLALGTGMGLPWVVNIFCVGLTIALVYRLGRELYDETAGIAAAALLSLSPIALIQAGSLMSHTAALLFVTLFLYALWRMERGRYVLAWGALAGTALGVTFSMRPLAGLAVVAPAALYCLLRLAWLLWRDRPALWPALRPMLVLGALALLAASWFPAANYAVVGDPTANLYTLVWDYDKVGFGEGYGRYSGTPFLNVQREGIKLNMRTHAGHNPTRGWGTLKKDWKCYSRDLFGWVGPGDEPPKTFVGANECAVDGPGYSWVLLPIGFLLMSGRRWSALLLVTGGAVILVNIAYWVGAGVYSARYFYEASSALALVTGAGVAGIARLSDRLAARPIVYAVFFLALLAPLVNYTPDRLAILDGYGQIQQSQIDELQALRGEGRLPAMVVAYGDHHWREVAAFMALTDPYAESEVILLRDGQKRHLEAFIRQYPSRERFYYVGRRLYTQAEFDLLDLKTWPRPKAD